jgi:hypothetical protein
MLKRFGLLTLCTLALYGAASAPALAATGDHGLPGEYLTYDIGARAAGMAGAMAGLADDISAIFYNPAGLAKQNPVQVGVQHVLLFNDTMFDFLGFGMPIQDFGNIGLGIVSLNSTGFILVDEGNRPLSLSNSIDQSAVYISYARDLESDISVGANLKVLYESIFSHSGTGIGIDIGGLYTPIPEFQVGLYLNNALSPKVLDETFPGGATLGIASKLFNEAFLLDADVSKSFGGQGLKWKVGGQVDVYESMAFVRAGLDDEMRVALGVGGKYMGITLDYSTSIEGLGLAHKISAGYSFGGYEVKVTAAPKIFSPVGIKKDTTIAIIATSKYPIRSWELNIKDQNGDVIKSVSGEDNPPNQVVWNGKDDRGLPAADGNFSIQLAVTDANGKTTKSNVDSVKIQSAVPLGDEGTGLEMQ